MRLNLYRTSSDTTGARKRRSAMAMRMRKYTGLFCAMLIPAAMAAAGWHWRGAIADEAVRLSAGAGYRLERIELEGRINTDRDAIMRTAGLTWHRPMLTLDLQEVHDRLASLGWVAGVRVERRLPATLIITLEERTALALLQTDAGHSVIDRTGRIITGVAAADFTHLQVIKGDGAAEAAAEMLAMLKTEPELFAEVWSLSYLSGRRWDVYLRNNIRIQLPEENPAAAWKKLAAMENEHRLIQRDIVNIDLRIPGRLVIRPMRNNTAREGSST